MVRSVTTFDPDWTDEDRSLALAWAEEEANRCSGCGVPRDEGFDPEHSGNWFQAEAHVCHACEAKDRARRDAADKKHDTAGVYWTVRGR